MIGSYEMLAPPPQHRLPHPGPPGILGQHPAFLQNLHQAAMAPRGEVPIPHHFKHVQGNMDINWRHHGAMIGKQGWKISEISNLTGTVIRFPHMAPRDEGSGEANSVGVAGTINAVEHCYHVLMNCIPIDMLIHLRDKKAEQLLNPFRDDIQMLKHRSGVHIFVFEEGEEVAVRSVAGPDQMVGALSALKTLLGDELDDEVRIRLHPSGVFRAAVEQAVDGMDLDGVTVKLCPPDTPVNEFYLDVTGKPRQVFIARRVILGAIPVYLTIQVPHGLNIETVAMDQYRGKIFLYHPPGVNAHYTSHVMMATAQDVSALFDAARVIVEAAEVHLRDQHRQMLREMDRLSSVNQQHHLQRLPMLGAGFHQPRLMMSMRVPGGDPAAFVPPQPFSRGFGMFRFGQPPVQQQPHIHLCGDPTGDVLSCRSRASPYYHPGNARRRLQLNDSSSWQWQHLPGVISGRHQSNDFFDGGQHPEGMRRRHRSGTRHHESKVVVKIFHEDGDDGLAGGGDDINSDHQQGESRSSARNFDERRFRPTGNFTWRPRWQRRSDDFMSLDGYDMPPIGLHGRAGRRYEFDQDRVAGVQLCTYLTSSGKVRPASSVSDLWNTTSGELGSVEMKDAVRIRRISFDRPFIFRPDGDGTDVAPSGHQPIEQTAAERAPAKRVHWPDFGREVTDFFEIPAHRRSYSRPREPDACPSREFYRRDSHHPCDVAKNPLWAQPPASPLYPTDDINNWHGGVFRPPMRAFQRRDDLQGGYPPYEGGSRFYQRKNEWTRSKPLPSTTPERGSNKTRKEKSGSRVRFSEDEKKRENAKVEAKVDEVEKPAAEQEDDGWQKVENKKERRNRVRNKRRTKVAAAGGKQVVPGSHRRTADTGGGDVGPIEAGKKDKPTEGGEVALSSADAEVTSDEAERGRDRRPRDQGETSGDPLAPQPHRSGSPLRAGTMRSV